MYKIIVTYYYIKLLAIGIASLRIWTIQTAVITRLHINTYNSWSTIGPNFKLTVMNGKY